MTLPLKKRKTIATKTIPNLRRAAEAISNGDDDDEQTRSKYIELHLQQLQSIAFQTLLKAFALEKSVNTNKRNLIIERLMKEWNITEEARGVLEEILESELWEEHQRDDIPAFDTNTVIEAQPLTTHVEDQTLPASAENEATTNMDSGVTVASSWGGVSPQSLVGIYVQIRLPGEDYFTEYVIKGYDVEKDMHRFETVSTNATMEENNPLSWIDIRHIPARDIMWEGGINPWEGDKN